MGWELTIQTRVVIVDGLHGAAEIELDVALDQPGVEGAQMAAFVVDADGDTFHTRRFLGAFFPPSDSQHPVGFRHPVWCFYFGGGVVFVFLPRWVQPLT